MPRPKALGKEDARGRAAVSLPPSEATPSQAGSIEGAAELESVNVDKKGLPDRGSACATAPDGIHPYIGTTHRQIELTLESRGPRKTCAVSTEAD